MSLVKTVATAIGAAALMALQLLQQICVYKRTTP